VAAEESFDVGFNIVPTLMKMDFTWDDICGSGLHDNGPNYFDEQVISFLKRVLFFIVVSIILCGSDLIM